ncbi:MAG: alpha-L-fucosidase [Tannerellaceae bacterium]
MKTKHFLLVFFYSFFIMVCNAGIANKHPHIVEIEKDDITRLIPREATLTGGIKLYSPEEHYKVFWAEKWNQPTQKIKWNLHSNGGRYKVALLVSIKAKSSDASMSLLCSTGETKQVCCINNTKWQRIWLEEEFTLKRGISELSLQILSEGSSIDTEVKLFAVEVVNQLTYSKIKQESMCLRSDTKWMQKIPYGFFINWNSCCMPMQGNPLSYQEAAEAFNVTTFAKTMDDCGAKVIVLTTSWAGYYFPGPIKAIDAILPGRTSQRDLVADLSDALHKYGIKLILYYHVGHGDKEWWDKQNFKLGAPGNAFINLEKIIREVSLRYKEKIAGFWFDDGIGYYPNKLSFRKITKAAKAGNKNAVVCYNPWILPKLTDFQDFYSGELGITKYSAGLNDPYLLEDGNGVFAGGPQIGLQATYTGLLEKGDWTHRVKDTPISQPILTIEQLENIINISKKKKNLPIINVLVYQNGAISPASYNLLVKLKNRIK